MVRLCDDCSEQDLSYGRWPMSGLVLRVDWIMGGSNSDGTHSLLKISQRNSE